jgi:hypothetical protein
MTRRIFVVAFLLLAATVAFAGERTVITDQHIHSEGPTFAQDCNGNLLIFNASTHLHETSFIHDGTFHRKFHINSEGTLTDINGTVWHFHGSANNTENSPLGLLPWDHAQASTIVSRFRGITAGPADNTFINVSIHTTRTPTGEFTSSRFEFSVECH